MKIDQMFMVRNGASGTLLGRTMAHASQMQRLNHRLEWKLTAPQRATQRFTAVLPRSAVCGSQMYFYFCQSPMLVAYLLINHFIVCVTFHKFSLAFTI